MVGATACWVGASACFVSRIPTIYNLIFKAWHQFCPLALHSRRRRHRSWSRSVSSDFQQHVAKQRPEQCVERPFVCSVFPIVSSHELDVRDSLVSEPPHRRRFSGVGGRSTEPLSDSQPGSPRSSLPSPSSPSGDSVSSFPSVSSSFLFSSQPATPPQIDAEPAGHLDAQADDNSELIIPSLTLPSLVKPPTAYGKTLGDLKLIVLARRGSESELELLLKLLADEEHEDLIDVGHWEDFVVDPDSLDVFQTGIRGQPTIRRVSSDWIEHRDAHGLEKYEPSRNIEIVHLPDYDSDQDVSFSRVACLFSMTSFLIYLLTSVCGARALGISIGAQTFPVYVVNLRLVASP